MSAAVPARVASSGSARLLADVRALGGPELDPRPPALIRLEETLGREFTDRLLMALAEAHDAPVRKIAR